jgi:hypothetical protein
MTPKSGAGFLIAAYLVFGMEWTSMETSYEPTPSFQNVASKKCTKYCGTTNGRYGCTTICSTPNREPTKATNAPPHGSTGPTKPAPPKTSGAQHY